MIRSLLCLYAFFLPFTSAFAPSTVTPIPVLLAVCIALAFFADPARWSIPFDGVTTLLFAILGVGTVALLLNVQKAFDGKPLNHYLSIVFFVVGYMLAVPTALRGVANSRWFDGLHGWLHAGLLIAAAFGIFEFVVGNFVSASWVAVPRPVWEEYDATVLGFLQRARSFAEESGHFASYLGVVTPLVVHRLWVTGRRGMAYATIFLVIGALACSFSVGGFLMTMAALAATVVFRSSFRLQTLATAIITALAVVMLLAAVPLLLFPDTFGEIILGKFSTVSFEERSQTTGGGLAVWGDADAARLAFGYGPAAYAHLGIAAPINLYANWLLQFGLIGLALLLLLQLTYLRRLLRVDDPGTRLALLFAWVFGTGFFLSIGNYWYPWYWFLFAWIDALLVRQGEPRAA